MRVELNKNSKAGNTKIANQKLKYLVSTTLKLV